MLKRRFHRIDNRLQYDPETAGKIIVACAMLHNFAIDHNNILPEEEPLPQDENEFFDGFNQRGNQARALYIARYFTNTRN